MFIGTALSLAAMLVRSGLRQVAAYTPSRGNEARAWRSLEDFWAFDLNCTKQLRGARRGESVVTRTGSGPRVGASWRDTGLIVKDVYLLTLTDEVAWHVRRRDHSRDSLYVKITLIPAPREGVELNVSYLRHAPSMSRIFHVRGRSKLRGLAGLDNRVWSCQAASAK